MKSKPKVGEIWYITCKGYYSVNNVFPCIILEITENSVLFEEVDIIFMDGKRIFEEKTDGYIHNSRYRAKISNIEFIDKSKDQNVYKIDRRLFSAFLKYPYVQYKADASTK
jgi:hypothetical protein